MRIAYFMFSVALQDSPFIPFTDFFYSFMNGGDFRFCFFGGFCKRAPWVSVSNMLCIPSLHEFLQFSEYALFFLYIT